MGAFLVVPADPVPDLSPGVVEILKQMLPHALLLQAPEEALDYAVLFGSVSLRTQGTEAGDTVFFRSPRIRDRGVCRRS